jgi:hypothetical protein
MPDGVVSLARSLVGEEWTIVGEEAPIDGRPPILIESAPFEIVLAP